jgi:hypothetical protein
VWLLEPANKKSGLLGRGELGAMNL